MHLIYLLGVRARSLLQWLARPTTVEQRNVRNVLIDGIGVGIVGGVATFLPVFLVRLGASSLLVGLLTSMPALTGMLLALPVGRLLERQRNIVPWYSRARILVLSSYALTGLVPFLIPLSAVPVTIIAIWALATIPQTIVNIAFTLVMSGAAGPDRRYYLMSRRWSFLGLATAISVALVGVLLDRIVFPLNYQVVFIASFAGGMLSFAFSSRISIPDNAPGERQAEQLPWRLRMQEWLAGLREHALYSRFLLSQFVLRCGLALAMPIFPLYWVRELQASDAWIGIISTVQSGVLLVAYFVWAGVSRRKGGRLVLLVCGFGLAWYPLLTGLTHSVPPLALYAGLAGFFMAGIDLVLFDMLLSVAPQRRSASYIALYQLTNYVATLLAPLVGTALAEVSGYAPALFVSSGLRFAGMALFVLLGVGAVRRK